MDFPRGTVWCYAESECQEKREALLKRGFQQKRIQKQLMDDGKKLDISIMELFRR
jgi:hypothetical protein